MLVQIAISPSPGTEVAAKMVSADDCKPPLRATNARSQGFQALKIGKRWGLTADAQASVNTGLLISYSTRTLGRSAADIMEEFARHLSRLPPNTAVQSLGIRIFADRCGGFAGWACRAAPTSSGEITHRLETKLHTALRTCISFGTNLAFNALRTCIMP